MQIHDPLRAMLADFPLVEGEDYDIQFPGTAPAVIQVEPMSDMPKNILRRITAARCIWDFDRRNVARLSKYGTAEWRPIIWTKTLQFWATQGRKPKRDIDILLLGVNSPEREAALEHFRAAGVAVRHELDTWGPASVALMRRAKVCLNIHRAGPEQAQECLRMAWAMCAGALVVSEPSIDGSYGPELIREASLAGLPEVAQKVANGYTEAEAKARLEAFQVWSEARRADCWHL